MYYDFVFKQMMVLQSVVRPRQRLNFSGTKQNKMKLNAKKTCAMIINFTKDLQLPAESILKADQ